MQTLRYLSYFLWSLKFEYYTDVEEQIHAQHTNLSVYMWSYSYMLIRNCQAFATELIVMIPKSKSNVENPGKVRSIIAKLLREWSKWTLGTTEAEITRPLIRLQPRWPNTHSWFTSYKQWKNNPKRVLRLNRSRFTLELSKVHSSVQCSTYSRYRNNDLIVLQTIQ